MPSPANPADVLEFLMLGLGAIFLFKRLADIDKFREFRLFVITLILSVAVTIFFIGYGFSFADSVNTDCPDYHYCQTEM